MVSMMRSVILFGLVAVAGGLSMLRTLTRGMDLPSLKARMVGVQVFQDKVAQVCDGAGPECRARAEDSLFCTLLQRSSQPHVAQLYCDGGEL
mmetsp:Transcript_50010/g.140184  ORF Transcript_50010/g.140184 Transcript_50010/m.140184 type:complete len:92 (+) Transcript_50010:136-411(+)